MKPFVTLQLRASTEATGNGQTLCGLKLWASTLSLTSVENTGCYTHKAISLAKKQRPGWTEEIVDAVRSSAFREVGLEHREFEYTTIGSRCDGKGYDSYNLVEFR